MIMGREQTKYDAIWRTVAWLLKNIRIFSKKSMIRYKATKEMQVIRKKRKNSFKIYLSSSFNPLSFRVVFASAFGYSA
jgi:hypothetical protein